MNWWDRLKNKTQNDDKKANLHKRNLENSKKVHILDAILYLVISGFDFPSDKFSQFSKYFHTSQRTH